MKYKKLISHRGNISGPIEDFENNPEYINDTIINGFDVEIDLRIKDGDLYLGHDFAQYKINFDWLEKNFNRLWIHCKDIDSYSQISNFKNLTFFCHSSDDFSLISSGYLWVHNLSLELNDKCVIPLINLQDIENHKFSKKSVYAICTDYIINFK